MGILRSLVRRLRRVLIPADHEPVKKKERGPTRDDLLAYYQAVKAVGANAWNTSDPLYHAGSYLEWANGSVPKAINVLQAHCSGQYIDSPRFPGCDEALAILQRLEQDEAQ